jgi:ribose 5-phosphate isomerase
MLDATDTKTVSAMAVVRWVHERIVEAQVEAIGVGNGSTPIDTIRARADERTRQRKTVARSRIKSNHSIKYKIVFHPFSM